MSDLKAITKPEIQNEIRVLLPYLEVTSNHSYLIARLKKLSEVNAHVFLHNGILYRVDTYLDTFGMEECITKEKNGARMIIQQIQKF